MSTKFSERNLLWAADSFPGLTVLSRMARISFMLPVLRNVVVPHNTLIAFLVAYGEFAIGLGLIFGVLTRTASFFGLLLMLAMLFSSDFPGADAALWNYFGASLSHSGFAMCFLTFIFGDADRALAIWSRVARP